MKKKKHNNCFAWDNDKEFALYRCICADSNKEREKNKVSWNKYICDHESRYTYNSFQYWKEYIEKQYITFSKEQLYEFYHYITNLKRENQTYRNMSSVVVFPLFVAILGGIVAYYITKFELGEIQFLCLDNPIHVIADMIIIIFILCFGVAFIGIIFFLIFFPISSILKVQKTEQMKDNFYNDIMEIIGDMINKKSQ